MDYTVEELMNDGFTIKMANYFHSLMKKEWEYKLWSDDYIEWAHSKGFLAESASVYNLDDSNISEFLSDYNYYKVWPLNSWERIWINDKLTLKYLLSDTKFDKYMPKYFYYQDSERGLISLVDNDNKESGINAFVNTLRKERIFAAKPCNGSGSQGFYRIEYIDGKIVVNGDVYDVDELNQFLLTHQNFVFTEYLIPHKKLFNISPLIHTLRIVVLNNDGNNPKIIGGYLRFANSSTGAANHTTGITESDFDVDLTVNWETGEFFDARAVGLNKVSRLQVHPDSKVALKGSIPMWDEIISFVTDFSNKYSLCQYLGFDLCVSTSGIKLMEINSHPGIKHMQLARPLLIDECTRAFFLKKLNDINSMNEAQMKLRHSCWR